MVSIHGHLLPLHRPEVTQRIMMEEWREPNGSLRMARRKLVWDRIGETRYALQRRDPQPPKVPTN